MRTPLLLLLLFLATTTLSAQVYIGPVAGGSLSWTKFDDDKYNDAYDVQARPGWHAGANISLKVRKRFFLHTSILYATKGRKLTGLQDQLLTNTARYDYVEMPIVYAVDFKAQLGNGKQFKYYFGIGPNVSYWLGGKGTLYNSDLAESGDYAERELAYRVVFRGEDEAPGPDEMNVADPNRVQLGLNLATGAVLEPLPHQRVLVMLRYELGHSFLSRTSNGEFAPTYFEDVLQARNKGVRLSVSYMIDLRTEDRKRGKSTIKNKKRR